MMSQVDELNVLVNDWMGIAIRDAKELKRVRAVNADLLEVLLKVDGCLQEYIEFLDCERFSNDDEVELLVLVQAAIAKAKVG